MRARAIYRTRGLKYASEEEKKGRKGKKGEGRKETFLERRFAEQVIGPAVVNEAIPSCGTISTWTKLDDTLIGIC